MPYPEQLPLFPPDLTDPPFYRLYCEDGPLAGRQDFSPVYAAASYQFWYPRVVPEYDVTILTYVPVALDHERRLLTLRWHRTEPEQLSLL